MATIGNLPPALNAHVTMNTRIGENDSQVVSAKQHIMQHNSTKWKLQQVIKLSADIIKNQRLPAKKTAMVTIAKDPSTLTRNPNLNQPPQAILNSFVQPFALTLPFTAPQPWTMPEYVASPSIPFFGASNRHLIVGTGN